MVRWGVGWDICWGYWVSDVIEGSFVAEAFEGGVVGGGVLRSGALEVTSHENWEV